MVRAVAAWPGWCTASMRSKIEIGRIVLFMRYFPFSLTIIALTRWEIGAQGVSSDIETQANLKFGRYLTGSPAPGRVGEQDGDFVAGSILDGNGRILH